MSNVEKLIADRGFQDVNPISCGYESCDPLHSWGYGVRDYFLFHYVMKGKGTFIQDGKKCHPAKGDLFLIRPGKLVFYQADPIDPWAYCWIGFRGRKAEELLRACGFLSEADCLSAPQAGPVFHALCQLEDQRPDTELILSSKLYELFALLTEKGTVRKRHVDYYIDHAIHYIQVNYASPVTVQRISDMLGIDRHYFCRIFSQKTGFSPQEFLIHTRMECSRQLLETGKYSIHEIARSVGYDDPFNFSKMFKKYYGKSPQNYKK